MLSGKMPLEHFPETTECQGSEDAYYTQHTKYKIYPNIFLTDDAGSKPSTSSSKFDKATEKVLPINAGIVVNDPSCKLELRTALKTQNFIYAKYTGKIPLSFYGPKTKKGERFRLIIENNDLEQRTFCKKDDKNISAGSNDKTTQYV